MAAPPAVPGIGPDGKSDLILRDVDLLGESELPRSKQMFGNPSLLEPCFAAGFFLLLGNEFPQARQQDGKRRPVRSYRGSAVKDVQGELGPRITA